jgi:hypothetical protein
MNIIQKMLTISCLMASMVVLQADPVQAQPPWRPFIGPRILPGRRIIPPPPPRVTPRPPVVIDPTPDADANPLPPADVVPGIVMSRIVNPIENEVALKYALTTFFVDEDGYTQRRIRKFTLAPGQHQDLIGERRRVISYDRGGEFGLQQYRISAGQYTFRRGDRGWDLRRTTLVLDE